VAGAPGLSTSSDDVGPWTVLRIIRWSGSWLGERGVETGRLDAEHLLAHALETTRLQLYLQYDRPLDADELAAFRPLLRRRGTREPLQYIVGRAAFRHLELAVDSRVLIPRPETEELVQIVLDWAGEREGLAALDVGTGSGCIAFSLLAEGPFERVVATDVSASALEVARLNADALEVGSGWECREGAGFAPVLDGERFDVVVSNPPYVAAPDSAGLQPEVRDWEPAEALFAGDDGLSVLDGLVTSSAGVLRPEGLIALEVGLGQAEMVRRRIEGQGGFERARVHRDLTGRPRFVTAHRA
jgi:release factor glutamine methyltransferase